VKSEKYKMSLDCILYNIGLSRKEVVFKSEFHHQKKMTKAGLFGISLNTYWRQFDELLDNFKKYQEHIKKRIEEFGVQVTDAGMVDNPAKARQAADYLKTEDVEIVFLYVSTYALSSTVLPVAQKLKVPVIILNLQPVAQLDYNQFNQLGDRGKMTGVWLEHCQACSVPEIATTAAAHNMVCCNTEGWGTIFWYDHPELNWTGNG
jgi:L-arabinose isomerase